jgi:4-amino-4-deoxy-L-arabinose transferase-like glycosyltransferase
MLQRLSIKRLLLASLVLIAVTRVPAVAHPRALSDEAYYAVVANEMLHGGLPYRDAVDRKPPLLYGIFWAVFRVAGYPNWPAIHLAAVGWTLATMALLYLLGRQLFTPLTGAIAGLLYGAFQPYLTITNLAFNGEMMMNLPIAAAMAIALRPGRRPLGLEPFVAGGLVAIAFLLKQPAGVALLPLAVYCVHPAYRAARGYGKGITWWHASLVGAGFVLVLAITTLILSRLGILPEAWYWTVQNHDLPHGPFDLVFWERAARSGWWFGLFCGPLLIGSWLSLRRSRERWRGREAERDALIVFLLASLIGTAASGRWFAHYYLQLLPPLALLAAPALAEIWQTSDPAPAARRVRGLVLGWTALSVLVSFVIELYSGLFQPRTPSPATAWLSSRVESGDRIFVWGQDPHYYLDTGTRPASRYFASFPLTGYVFGAPESWDPRFDTSNRIAPHAWENLAEDFSRHLPSYIVDTDGARTLPRYPMANYPFLAQLISSRYRLELRASDALIYVRRE